MTTPSSEDMAVALSDMAPCPFCGTAPVHRETIEHYSDPTGSFSCRHSVACDDCGIEISEEYAEDAFNAWNRRATPSIEAETVKAVAWQWRKKGWSEPAKWSSWQNGIGEKSDFMTYPYADYEFRDLIVASPPQPGVVEALRDLVNALDLELSIYDGTDCDMPVMTSARKALAATGGSR